MIVEDKQECSYSLACLEIRSRNEEAINSTRNRICSLKVFVSDDRKYVCGRRLYMSINTRKFKGLDSREITPLPEIKEMIYMVRHLRYEVRNKYKHNSTGRNDDPITTY